MFNIDTPPQHLRTQVYLRVEKLYFQYMLYLSTNEFCFPRAFSEDFIVLHYMASN